MDKGSIMNQFNDYYIKENRIKHIEALSHDIPVDEINIRSRNQITIGNTVIEIPDNVLELANENNIDIDTNVNSDDSIYYVNKNVKKYCKIGHDILLENYKLKKNEILNFNFESDVFEKLDLKFIIIEFSESKGLIARQYSSLTNTKVLPHEDATFIRVFLTAENPGFIFNAGFYVTIEPMDLVSEHEFEVNSDNLYNPDTRVAIIENEESISINVPDLHKKFIYFSYGIQNNSFNKIPETSLIDVNPKSLYEIHCPFRLHDELEFTPTVIEYNSSGKTNLIKLGNQIEFIKFQKDTTSIRLSYRFSGAGEVEIENIKINEYEGENDFDDVQWSSRHEIDTHMKTVQNVHDLRVAVIMDEFTYHSYKYEANLLRLSFDNWENEITSFMPHFVFIESSWHGNESEWTKNIAYVTEEKHSHIKKLISYAKSLDIPIVFWNKEDPVHYEHFIETAKLCDFVFTTDRDKVDSYKQDCNHENVDVLQFAAQPKTHNPIKIQKERVEGISFAGSYYALREERSADMNRLFRASIPYNLYIYDRNYEYTIKGERLNFLFPEEFRKYILGSLPFYQIDKAYKGYKFMININTVKYSPTMYARRVYEGLASGTPIISNYSLGMEKQFGDIVGYSEDQDELQSYLTKLNDDESEYQKVKQLGIRRVLSRHTYAIRMNQIATKIGFDFKEMSAKVTLISFAKNEDDINNLVKTYDKLNYDNKELVVISKENENDYSTIDSNITVLSEKRIIDNFMTLDKMISTEYFAPISSEDFYTENYLEDLLLATTYSNADIIGKNSYYYRNDNNVELLNSFSEHEYTDSVNGFASIIKSNVFSKLSLIESLSYLKNEKPYAELKQFGLSIFSSDKMNYIKDGKSLIDSLKTKVIV